MKNHYKKIFSLFILFVFALVLVGCGGSKPEPEDPGTNPEDPGTEDPGTNPEDPGTEDPGTEPEQPKFDEANYTINKTYVFESTLTLDVAKEQLATAQAYLKTKKVYSYTVKLDGNYDDIYSYEGVAKIDASGVTPKASLELSGDEEFAFYLSDGKAYINYDGDKSSYDATGDLTDLLDAAYVSLGAFVRFDAESITEENLEFAGIDEFGATVIQTNEEGKIVTIVLFEGAIQKVLYTNEEAIEYTAVYSYANVEVVLPSDLELYNK